ncbi:hypothetical protein CHH28_06585 [Bacterioplanes sanyensis]|uniref:Uncharacterized protein n=1 Tax=Bacterioplanes sanyensis TaxID=1249553 RepID=A0A222FH28_9GAMM|nr:hypothetical protein [Bacterioplanes sanyensis]ASP38365.1 hypothetical protein CHH28_06585 [Bacterioplanes sanyensis]
MSKPLRFTSEGSGLLKFVCYFFALFLLGLAWQLMQKEQPPIIALIVIACLFILLIQLTRTQSYSSYLEVHPEKIILCKKRLFEESQQQGLIAGFSHILVRSHSYSTTTNSTQTYFGLSLVPQLAPLSGLTSEPSLPPGSATYSPAMVDLDSYCNSADPSKIIAMAQQIAAVTGLTIVIAEDDQPYFSGYPSTADQA